MNLRRRLGFTVSAICLVLFGCADTEPNVADRLFVAEMIPHHHLGMELIDQATRRVDDTRVRRLVFEMSTYHQSELDQLHDWAKEWNVLVATDFPGRLDSVRLAGLAALSGTDYDRRWLELMIEHHEGALDIAQRQIDRGSVDASIDMATAVRDVQTKDIEEMENLLVSLDHGE